MTGRSGGASRRLRGLMRKEALQIIRDPSSISIAFVLPRSCCCCSATASRSTPSMCRSRWWSRVTAARPPASPPRSPIPSTSRPVRCSTARPPSRRWSPAKSMPSSACEATFAPIFSPGGAPIQVIVNGIDANTARIVVGYVQGAWQTWLKQYALDHGPDALAASHVEHRVWFNAEVRSRNFLVPGLIAIIMTLIGALLTAWWWPASGARHDGGADGHAGPNRRNPAGQADPLFPAGHGRHGAVDRDGRLGLRRAASRLAGFAVRRLGALHAGRAGHGLLISTVARSQFVAGQVAIIVAFLPAFILSGFIFDINSMPSSSSG